MWVLVQWQSRWWFIVVLNPSLPPASWDNLHWPLQNWSAAIASLCFNALVASFSFCLFISSNSSLARLISCHVGHYIGTNQVSSSSLSKSNASNTPNTSNRWPLPGDVLQSSGILSQLPPSRCPPLRGSLPIPDHQKREQKPCTDDQDEPQLSRLSRLRSAGAPWLGETPRPCSSDIFSSGFPTHLLPEGFHSKDVETYTQHLRWSFVVFCGVSGMFVSCFWIIYDHLHNCRHSSQGITIPNQLGMENFGNTRHSTSPVSFWNNHKYLCIHTVNIYICIYLYIIIYLYLWNEPIPIAFISWQWNTWNSLGMFRRVSPCHPPSSSRFSTAAAVRSLPCSLHISSCSRHCRRSCHGNKRYPVDIVRNSDTLSWDIITINGILEVYIHWS